MTGRISTKQGVFNVFTICYASSVTSCNVVISSEEEDELEEDKILESVFNSYSEFDKENNGYDKTQQALSNALKSGVNVCLICIASVKRQDEIWSCECCYSSFHLSCIQKWGKDSIYYQSSQIADQNSLDKDAISWCCPKCRTEYKQSESPSHYFCYCKKTRNPKFDPWIIPHSCEQKCNKSLTLNCGHNCLLLCHPGPCPPCPAIVHSTCFCGKQNPVVRRCSNKLWPCNKTCNKLLSCKQHKCSQLCHEGDCLTCPKESLQRCICGKFNKKVPCSSPLWQCDKPCGRPLDCSAHVCEEICHQCDTCGKCPKSGPRSCPCGKSVVNLPCTEEVGLCGDTCSKLLPCGVHLCSQRCHPGDCENCLQVVTKKCRCSLKTKTLPCHKSYTCETKCKRQRDCRRHPCNKKCCVGLCPPCEQQCGRMLGCRNHKCTSRCHQGPCYPCQLIIPIKCNCGKTVINVPCGREKSTKPPRCRKPCIAKPDCHHPFRTPHPCHFGDCPPCKLICLQNLRNCNHTCPAKCHSAILTKINDANQKRAGPWEAVPTPVMKVVNQPCPPCPEPVPVTCIGKHETHKFPCSEARLYSCGRACGRLLKCGNHYCSFECHEVENSPSTPSKAGDNCVDCNEECNKPRLSGCNHKCLKPCHPYECPPCKQMVKIKCHCSLSQLYILCQKYLGDKGNPQTKEQMLSCKNQCPLDLPCKHRCQKICHSKECTPPSECKKKITIRCRCKRLKRDIPCFERLKKETELKCDDICLHMVSEEKKKKEKDEERIKLLEEQKQKEELELYQRKLEGKKRKQRKPIAIIESEPVYKKKSFIIGMGAISTAILAVFAYYLLSI
ncbi:NF-X1-type zinc finger protein NFXL1 [Nymphon striatum]|nr:NF-X1-type zinc finger protein NFXL1 [Nymphon striatum]